METEVTFPQSQLELLAMCSNLAKMDVQSCLAGITTTNPELIENVLNPGKARIRRLEIQTKKKAEQRTSQKKARKHPKKTRGVKKRRPLKNNFLKRENSSRRRSNSKTPPEASPRSVHSSTRSSGSTRDNNRQNFVPLKPVSRRVFQPQPVSNARPKKRSKKEKLEEGFNLRWALNNKPNNFDQFKNAKKRKPVPRKKKKKKKVRVLKVGPGKDVKNSRTKKKRTWNYLQKLRAFQKLKNRMVEQNRKADEEDRKRARIDQRRREMQEKRTPKKLIIKQEIEEKEVPKKKDRETSTTSTKQTEPSEPNDDHLNDQLEDEVKNVDVLKHAVEQEQEMLNVEEQINRSQLHEIFETYATERAEIQDRLNMIRRDAITVSIDSSIATKTSENERVGTTVETGKHVGVIDDYQKSEILQRSKKKKIDLARVNNRIGGNGGSSRTQLIEVLSEAIVDDIILDVGKEIFSTSDEVVEVIFNNEFKL